jgi:photosystem II stability/assembly factor-like uncharacterized protein
MQNIAYNWTNVEIVGGGFITGILFHPKQKDLLYARTDIGGAYRWNPTTQRWMPLQDFFGKSDWNLYGVESIGIDPTDPNRLYLAVGTYTNNWAGNGALLSSKDQGRSFQRTDLPFKNGGNEDGRSIGERLAVNPKHNNTVYFGTRHEGLWRSDDFGKTWRQDTSFPVKGSADSIGIGFVVFDRGVIYVAIAASGASLYRSKDDGKTWEIVPGQPMKFLPHHGAFDKAGNLYLTYGDKPGPNGMSDGAVWKWHPQTGVWTEITPVKPGTTLGNFGYAGLAIDANRPGTLWVSSMDKWSTKDDIWHSTDGGKNWQSLLKNSVRDGSGSPFLFWGRPEVDLGHWIGALALDPFRPGHVLYGTGATIFGSDDADKLAKGQTTHWTVRAQGLEETAVLDLISPPSGPMLISALGDIGGFRHDDVRVVPARGQSLSPQFNTTNHLDFAEYNPQIVVASGNAKVHILLSRDGGSTWTALVSEPAGTRGSGRVALSVNGEALLWAPQGAPTSRTTDAGKTWTTCQGLPSGAQPVADRFDPKIFSAYDPNTGKVYVSSDAGVRFTETGATLPTGRDNRLVATGGAPDNLWCAARDGGLYHSTNSGKSFTKLPDVNAAHSLGFGLHAPGVRYPTVYLNGTVNNIAGVFRSTDVGRTWVRIDDPAHQFGTMNVITGDPRIHGRVYLGTNGRGILFADPK